MSESTNSYYYPLDPRRKRRRRSLLAGLVVVGLLIAVVIATSQIQVVREFFGQASGVPANIVVDTQAVLGPLPRPWRNLAQGGEDHNWRLGQLTNQVASLHPEYIRLDHIYDFYNVVQGQPGNISFNWQQLDLVIDDILATGAKPYLALSYMPTAISSGDILANPQQWSDWQAVVRETIVHLSGQRGISNVYYEVWNEPDLFGGFKYYGAKNYLTMYTYASAGAQQAAASNLVKPFKLGGPATTALYKNWFDAWAKGCSEHSWRCDFFSWHRYSYDVNQYAQDMTQVKNWLEAYPRLVDLELHITEWGHDSNNHTGYDTAYSAAHTVAAAIVMINRVERAFVFEIQDGKDPEQQTYWGRWGLFTHNDVGAQAKARFRGLQMLDSLAEQRLQCTGDGSWVKAIASKTSTGEVEVVLANFDAKARHSELVPITFEELTPGSYTILKKYLDGRQSQEVLTTETTSLTTSIPLKINDVVKIQLIAN